MAKVCGIQGLNASLPSDPDNNLVLTAVAGYGGVQLNWTLPLSNSHAVSYIKVFRSTTTFEEAMQIATCSGDRFFDETAIQPVSYHYWIQVVSINGTQGTRIGPASATPMQVVTKLLQELSGKIDKSVLGEQLKTDISKIGVLGTDLIEEAKKRREEYNALMLSLGQTQEAAASAFTYINNEISERKTALAATISGLDVRIASFNSNIAAIAQELELKVGPTSAIAKSIETLTTKVGDKSASGSTGLFQSIDSVTNSISNMWTAQVVTESNGTKLIGGFGINNNGTTIDAHFDVNNFSVGKAGLAIKPFIIKDDKVMINELIAKKVTFDTIEDSSGSFVVQNGKLKADYIDTDNITLQSGNTGPRMVINKDSITVYGDNGQVRVKIGKLS